jgi:arsenate reductase
MDLTPPGGLRHLLDIPSTDRGRTAHPIALHVLAEAGIDTGGLRAKSVREFLGSRGVRFAVVLSQERNEGGPRIFPFATQTLRWPIPDPTQPRDDDADARARFRAVRDDLETRLRMWLGEAEAPAVLAS